MELFSRFVAVLMLLVISPLILIISISSLLLQGFPVLFKHERVGYNFKTFSLYKFRTMEINNENQSITEPGDSRITAWGKILRALKLDETPQLYNILMGDMRFIGPRPEVQEFIIDNDFSFLKEIKPGLTDFSSILFRNEVEILSNAGGVNEYPKLLKLKVALGRLYADHKSFWLDLKLVILTLISIVLPKTAITLVKKFFINKYKPELIPEIKEWIK